MSRVQVWKQESPNKLTQLVYLPKKVQDGPRDDDIQIVGVDPVSADESGDFLLNPNSNIQAFDAVHGFSVVRELMTMYQRSCWRIGRCKPLKWQWGGSLRINPRAGINDIGACYSRGKRLVEFYTRISHERIEYNVRSFDIVAHEIGHAILDALRPGYWSSWQAETGALHESFADLTVIFGTLANHSLCRSIIFLSRGELEDRSYFWIASECNGGGNTSGDPTTGKGFSAANHDLTMYDIAAEVHDISLVFTGAIYDILVGIFKLKRDPDLRDDAETLQKASQQTMDLLVQAMLAAPPQNVTFKDIAEKMIACEKHSKIKQVIRQRFEKRHILGKDKIIPPSKPVDIRWGNCECCLSREEHLMAIDDRVNGPRFLSGVRRIIRTKSRDFKKHDENSDQGNMVSVSASFTKALDDGQPSHLHQRAEECGSEKKIDDEEFREVAASSPNTLCETSKYETREVVPEPECSTSVPATLPMPSGTTQINNIEFDDEISI